MTRQAKNTFTNGKGQTRMSASCDDSRRALTKCVGDVFDAIGKIYGIDFPVGELVQLVDEQSGCVQAVKVAKGLFCGLLDSYNEKSGHVLKPLLRSLSKKKRLTVACALVSGKKLLPEPCSCFLRDVEEKHRKLLGEPSAPPSRKYIRHCKKVIRKIFPRGWDRKYGDYVQSASYGLSATLENPKSKGGAIGTIYGNPLAQRDFIQKARGLQALPKGKPVVKYTAVKDAGKVRGITINSVEHQCLRPLHKLIYDTLTRQKWLLRGDITAAKLMKAGFGNGRKSGEVIVSGDYESATDNLNLETTEKVLRCLLEQTTSIPESVLDFAMASLQSRIEYSDEIIDQKRGQLMGNLLSFPLLCLQNYCAFTYLVRRPVPVLINGDDIVWKGKMSEYRIWRDGITLTGLKLSTGKTFVDHSLISINSTYFWSDSGRVSKLPCVRLGMLRRQQGDSAWDLGVNLKEFVSVTNEIGGSGSQRLEMRSRMEDVYLRHKRQLLQRAGLGPQEINYKFLDRTLGRRPGFRRFCYEMMLVPGCERINFQPHNMVGSPAGWVKVSKDRFDDSWESLASMVMVNRKWFQGFRIDKEAGKKERDARRQRFSYVRYYRGFLRRCAGMTPYERNGVRDILSTKGKRAYEGFQTSSRDEESVWVPEEVVRDVERVEKEGERIRLTTYGVRFIQTGGDLTINPWCR